MQINYSRVSHGKKKRQHAKFSSEFLIYFEFLKYSFQESPSKVCESVYMCTLLLGMIFLKIYMNTKNYEPELKNHLTAANINKEKIDY